MISVTITRLHMQVMMSNVTFVKMFSPTALNYKHTDNNVTNPNLHLQPQPHNNNNNNNNKKQPIHRAMMSKKLCLNFLKFNQMWWRRTACERFPYLQHTTNNITHPNLNLHNNNKQANHRAE
ncbi:uncharacterized protein LOC142618742 isoform X2 [Castanea sativa]|uniref:uncharacterized protein LOC142618742 isoform X2 n=1 Tax=Castanea sativa TaxID=21020 RepID=UPI003F64A805